MKLLYLDFMRVGGRNEGQNGYLGVCIIVAILYCVCDYVINREHSRLGLCFVLLIVESVMPNTMLGTQYIHVLMNE